MLTRTLLTLVALAAVTACSATDDLDDAGRASSAQQSETRGRRRDVSTAQAAVDAYYAEAQWRSTPAGTLEAAAPLGEWAETALSGVSRLVGSRYSQSQREAPNPYRTFCFPLAATAYARAYAAAHPSLSADVHDVSGEWIATHGVQSSVRLLEQLPTACATSVEDCEGGPVTLDDVRYDARPLDEGTLEALPAGEPLLVVGRPLDRSRVGHWVFVLKDEAGAIRIHQQAPLSYVSLNNASEGGGAFISTFDAADTAHDYLTRMARFIGFAQPTLLMAVEARSAGGTSP
jgi:hypothetical protein